MKTSSPFSTEIPASKALYRSRRIAAIVVFIIAIGIGIHWWYFFPFRKSHELLHVSFDAAHAAFPPIDKAFENQRKQCLGGECLMSTQFAGSIQQANGVAAGLIADVASFASPMEVIQIQKQRVSIDPDWRASYPYGSSPFYSTIVWVVKPSTTIPDTKWEQLLRPDIRPCMPDPDHSGAGRYAYFAVLVGFRETEITNLPVSFPSTYKLLLKTRMKGDRSSVASTYFLQNPSVNVMLTWESEALRILKKYPKENLTIVYPDISIETQPVVVECTTHTSLRNTGKMANSYLQFLYTEAAQQTFAKAGFRPRDEGVFSRYKDQFPPQKRVQLDATFGDWDTIYEEAFGPKGHFTWIQHILSARSGGAK